MLSWAWFWYRQGLGCLDTSGNGFLGAALTTFIVYTLATYKGRTDAWTLLLSGIAISSLVSSFITIVMVLKRERMDEIVFWTMGGLSRASWNSVFAALPYAIIGITALITQSRALNVMSYGEEPAFHMGVGIQQTKKKLLWFSALITASGVAFTGPIGFVGLIVPHAVRLIIGPDHVWLLPMSGVIGGGTLVMADLLARTIQPPAEVPVGVVTALFGAPFFLYLLFKVKRRPAMTVDGICLSGVSFGYGLHPVIKGIHLKIPPRSVTVVVGPNGAGKHTA